MSEKSQRIKSLCDAVVTALQTPTSIIPNPAVEPLRLLRNDIHFHELDYEDFLTALVWLNKSLIISGTNSGTNFVVTFELCSVVSTDHICFWAWAGELILSNGSNYFSPDEQELRELFSTVIRALLADSTPADSERHQALRIAADRLIEHNSSHLIQKRAIIASYLAFPLLEGILKKKCSAYVDSDGVVQSTFTVTRENGSTREYKQGKSCNSIADLLCLLTSRVLPNTVDPSDITELQNVLKALAAQVQSLDPTMTPFDRIYNWRNASLHGSDIFPALGGLILNFTIALCIDDLRATFEPFRAKAEERARFSRQSLSQLVIRPNWCFYPPF